MSTTGKSNVTLNKCGPLLSPNADRDIQENGIPPLLHEWPTTLPAEGIRKHCPPDAITDLLERFGPDGADTSEEGFKRWLQESARKALLTKYNLRDPNGVISDDEKWNDLIVSLTDDKVLGSVDENTPPKSQLIEMLSTSKSNGIDLRWEVMEIQPGAKFKMHAHPNIEMEFCLRGSLHEVRLAGPGVDIPFGYSPSSGLLDLRELKRPWTFKTLKTGSWMVNDVGSTHLSFTSSGDEVESTLLLVLWSGVHANVEEGKGPKGLDVPGLVKDIDDACCGGNTFSEKVGGLFLPQGVNDQG